MLLSTTVVAILATRVLTAPFFDLGSSDADTSYGKYFHLKAPSAFVFSYLLISSKCQVVFLTSLFTKSQSTKKLT